MTKSELLEKLADMPDDTVILLYDSTHDVVRDVFQAEPPTTEECEAWDIDEPFALIFSDGE